MGYTHLWLRGQFVSSNKWQISRKTEASRTNYGGRNQETKEERVFAKIETRNDALKIIKGASITFLIIAATGAIIAFYFARNTIDPVDPGVLAEPILFVALCLIFLKWKSRITAVLLLLITATVIPAMLNISGGGTANLVV